MINVYLHRPLLLGPVCPPQKSVSSLKEMTPETGFYRKLTLEDTFTFQFLKVIQLSL